MRWNLNHAFDFEGNQSDLNNLNNLNCPVTRQGYVRNSFTSSEHVMKEP